jgi:phospholipase/lecithinase/hemolysin
MRMLSCKSVLIAALVLVFMPLDASFGAGRLQVVAFGDSLLDAGTYSPFASKAPFHGGRYTTNPGFNFTQDIAHHYGDHLTPAFVGGFGHPLTANVGLDYAQGGLDYAQGGSRVALQPGIDYAPDNAQATTVPVSEQVSWYLSTYGRFTSDQLVLINGGADDIFFQLATAQPDPSAIVQAATDLATIIGTLVAKGATHVVVMNVPDIGMTPLGIASPPQVQLVLTRFSVLFNLTLLTALQQQNFGGKVILIDAFSFIDKLIGNFQTYGFSFSNKNIACNLPAQIAKAAELCPKNPGSLYCTNRFLFGSSLFCSPQSYTEGGANYAYMFADAVHPTTHLNELFALFVEQQLAGRIW